MNLQEVLKKDREDISTAIKKIQEFDENGDLTVFFTRGYCYYFAQMMKTMFPLGRILYNQRYGHFLFSYGACLWDITGNVTNKYYNDETEIDWEYLQVEDTLLASRIIKDCIKK